MTIKGNKIGVKKSARELYSIFTELSNFKKLMPEDTDKFEVQGDSFIFKLKGMPEIHLIIKEKIPFSKVILEAASGKFPFALELNITEIDDNKSMAQLIFNGNFNPMMVMMVKKPLTKFISVLTQNIEKL